MILIIKIVSCFGFCHLCYFNSLMKKRSYILMEFTNSWKIILSLITCILCLCVLCACICVAFKVLNVIKSNHKRITTRNQHSMQESIRISRNLIKDANIKLTQINTKNNVTLLLLRYVLNVIIAGCTIWIKYDQKYLAWEWKPSFIEHRAYDRRQTIIMKIHSKLTCKRLLVNKVLYN